MIFCRSSSGGRDISLRAMRILTFGALVTYPVGALTVAWGDSLPSAVGGYGLVLLSLICVMIVMGTSVQRVVGEQPDRLDEYELKLRYRAMSAAYTCLSALALVAIIYAAIGTDKGLWVPDSYEEYNGLFWGAFLYTSMLPSASLAWQIDAADIQPEA